MSISPRVPLKSLCAWRRFLLGTVIVLSLFSAINLILAALKIQ